MRNVILLMHVSLDGFVGGPNGEMDWIKLDAEMFDDVGKLTDEADTAIYGRNTFAMMEAYWPTAGDQPGATKHDIEHSDWTNKSLKLVFSTTRNRSDWARTKFISNNIPEEIKKIKQQPGKNLLMIGSPGLVKTFIGYNLIDEYRIGIAPVILGNGRPLFRQGISYSKLSLVSAQQFSDKCAVLIFTK